jgi:hypothetical protein
MTAAAIILFISLMLVQLLDRSTLTIADNVAIIETDYRQTLFTI